MPEHSPTTKRLRADAIRILRAGVAAADPAEAVRRALRLEQERLRVGQELELPLGPSSRVFLLAVGKGAAPMSTAALETLGDRISAASVTVLRQRRDGPGLPAGLPIWEAEHPVPAIGSFAAAAEALALARRAGEDDVVLCLLSGGASAMWAAPAPGVTLDDLRGTTAALLRCGAPIEAVNTVRKHLSAIAGGQLARAAAPAQVVTLAVSDVVGTGPDAIGSGPTLPDPTTFGQALEVVRRYAVPLPTRALQRLRAGAAGQLEETPGESDLANVRGFHVVLSIADALHAACAEARALGYESRVRTDGLSGEASEIGATIAGEAVDARRTASAAVALLWGGETTVTVRGEGRGGRNQEVALAAALPLQGVEGVVVASMGTDGRDGPTDAAGGMVDGGTVRRGATGGRDARAALEANDSYEFLRATGDLILTGPTGTNVNDLALALVTPSGAEG